MYRMVFERFFGKSKDEPDAEPATSESEDSEDGVLEEPSLTSPPGWDELRGTYERPVYPIDNSEVQDILRSVSTAADYTDVDVELPKIGTNKEHIKVRLYSLTNHEEPPATKRKLVVDVFITEFSSWIPEESEDYTYPGDDLMMNGPYYMHLADELEDVFNAPAFAFNFVSYDEDEDVALYSAEKSLKVPIGE